MNKLEVKKLDDIDATNIISLYDSLSTRKTTAISGEPENADKYDTRDKEQHNLQQLIKHSGLV